jgi:hypothetical protein
MWAILQLPTGFLFDASHFLPMQSEVISKLVSQHILPLRTVRVILTMSNPLPPNDSFFDSEDLMSWLLLNPEIVEFDESQLQLGDDILDSNSRTTQPPVSLNDYSESSANAFAGGISVKPEPGVLPKRASSSKIAKMKNESAGQASRNSKIGKKRQRESVEDIEARVNELRSENADLQAHLMNVTQRTTELQKQRMAMEKLMVTKLAEIGDREDSDQSELAKVVKQYTDIYADYGKCRQREVRSS